MYGMSFWKKIIGQTELTVEEKAKKEKEQQEKKRRKEIEAKYQQEQAEKRREEKRIEKEKRKAAELKKVERFFGPDPGMGKKVTYSAYKPTFEYVDKHVLRRDERVLGVIQAEFDKNKKTEIKGILIAAEEKLIFALVRGSGHYLEEFDYSKMKGISLKRDGLLSKELYIDYGRGRKKFDDIVDDLDFKAFLKAVNGKIAEFRNKPASKPASKATTTATTSETSVDKYKQLERIAELKEKGILTEEEFQAEKQKILK
jgi:hypothetical protein